MVDLHTVLQSINHYLSTRTHDLGISILSETCYKTLVLDVDLTSNKCIKLAISKVLGISIIAISSIVKVPQILKIISAGSASGISILSYLLETFAYLISLAYNVRQGFPFSTYGETGLIMAQNIVIIVLVLNYSGTAGTGLFFIACLAMSAVILFSRDILHIKALSYLQASAGVIGIASKLPQILTVWQEGGTGQLSAFVVSHPLFVNPSCPLSLGIYLMLIN